MLTRRWCLLLERLSVDYGKVSKVSFTVWSCLETATEVVEPYRTCTRSSLAHTEVTVVLDLESLYDSCLINLDIERSTHANLLNRFLVQIISSLTASSFLRRAERDCH